MYIYEVYENSNYFNCIDSTMEHINVNDIKKAFKETIQMLLNKNNNVICCFSKHNPNFTFCYPIISINNLQFRLKYVEAKNYLEEILFDNYENKYKLYDVGTDNQFIRLKIEV